MDAKQAIDWFGKVQTAEGYSPHTVSGYKFCLIRWMEYAGNPDVENVTRADLRQFFLHLQTETDLSSGTITKIWSSLRSFFKFLKQENVIAKRPDDIPMPKGAEREVKPLTKEEVKKLLSACEYSEIARTEDRKPFRMRRKTGLRDKAIIVVLLDTGLRVSELCRIQKQHIDLERGLIEVVPYKSGKKSRSRYVHLGKSALKVLLRYLVTRDDFEDPEAPLFTTMRNQAITRNSVRLVLKSIGDSVGIDVHPHKLRHTFAIQFLRNGGDVFSLRELLGHATLDMVQNYLHISQSDTENAHRTASPADNWRL